VQTTAGMTSWSQLAWLLRRASFFVGVDTAAMHLAAACDCPTVALFGPSPVFEYHPWQVKNWVLHPQNWLDEEKIKSINSENLMLRIPTDQVFAACLSAFQYKSK
jgi:heptosyltransferase-3